MSRIKIAFVETESGIPVVKCRIRSVKEPIYVVLDSGAELTTIDSRLGKGLVHEGDAFTCSVNGLISRKEAVFTKVKCSIATEGVDGSTVILHVEAYASELPELNLRLSNGDKVKISAILGCDILTSLDSKIDFVKKIWSISL